MAGPSREDTDELLEQARTGLERLQDRLVDAEHRLGEIEHATERRMLDVADKLPDPEDVRRRARALSERADQHLAEAVEQRARDE
jgi:hypothetical protein